MALQRCFLDVLGQDAEEVGAEPVPGPARGKQARRPIEHPDQESIFGPDAAPLPKPLVNPHSLFREHPLDERELDFKVTLDAGPPLRRLTVLGNCPPASEPCPHVRCRHHLAVNINEIGSLKVTWPGWDVDDIQFYTGATCSLRVAEDGPHEIAEVGEHMNLSEEEIRILMKSAFAKIRRRNPQLAEDLEGHRG